MKSSYHVEFRRILRQLEFARFSRQRACGGHLAHFEWLTVCHVSSENSVNLSSSVGPMWTHGMMPFEENLIVGRLSG